MISFENVYFSFLFFVLHTFILIYLLFFIFFGLHTLLPIHYIKSLWRLHGRAGARLSWKWEEMKCTPPWKNWVSSTTALGRRSSTPTGMARNRTALCGLTPSTTLPFRCVHASGSKQCIFATHREREKEERWKNNEKYKERSFLHTHIYKYIWMYIYIYI